MIFDRQNLLMNHQAITVTAPSENVIDLGSDRNIGSGFPLELTAIVTETFLSGGATTLVAALETDTVVGFGSAAVLVQTIAIPKATLVQGYHILPIKVPLGVKQFLRLNWTVATGPFTSGKILAGLNLGRDTWKAYASGIPVAGF